jgi:hypothetical protein
MSLQDDFRRVYQKYGAEAIASVLGVPAPTVRRWAGKGKSAGIPKSREAEIKALEQIRRHEGYEEKALREMMSEAQRIGKLPKPSNYNKRRNGEKTTGQEASQQFTGFLNEALLLQIRNYLETVPLARSLPNWLANVQMSALASDGSIYVAAPSRVQVSHAEADDFIVSALESSGLQHSRSQAIESLISKLRQKIHDGNRYFVHAARFSTYQYKTEAESRERRSQKRHERRRK